MKTISLRILAALLGLGVLWAIVSVIRGRDATDWSNQLAQAQKERDERQNLLDQAQKERDEYINKMWQDSMKNLEDLRKFADEQNKLRQVAISQVQPELPAAGPVAIPSLAAQAVVLRPAVRPLFPRVHKMTIYDGSVPTVNYFVKGGSPQLQALCRALESTENKLALARESQKRRPGQEQDAASALADELITLQEQVQIELQSEQDQAVAAGACASTICQPISRLCNSSFCNNSFCNSRLCTSSSQLSNRCRRIRSGVRQQIWQTQLPMMRRQPQPAANQAPAAVAR